jgi:exosortase A
MTTEMPSSAAKPVTEISPLRAWLPALICIVATCAVFGVAFWREIVEAEAVWLESTAYNHCFLVLPLVAALLWNRRETVARLQPSPSPWALALVPPLCAVWIFAALLELLEGEQLLVIALFEVLLLAVLGWRVFRALLGPLLFLFFLVPFGAFLVPVLQRFTASFAVSGLQLLGIPVFADGFLIQIPEGSFEVAEACAGLRFLIASIVFGCFFALIIYRSRVRRLVFIGLSIIIPVIANGLRVLGIIVLGHIEGSAAAVETDHILYGWIFFSLVTLLLIFIGMSFADHQDPPPAQIVLADAPSKFRVGATMTAGLLLTLLGPAYLMVIDRASAELPRSTLLSAPKDGVWAGEPGATIEWRPTVSGAKRESVETYHDDRATVVHFVALFPLPSRGSQFTKASIVTADQKNWRIAETDRMTLPRDGGAVTVNAAMIVGQGHHRLVWWFYVVDDQMTSSTLDAKLLQARTALLGGTHVGAFIALSTEASDRTTATAVLTRFLEAMGSWRDLRSARLSW